MACLESTLDILPSDRVIGNPLASPAALIRLEVLLGSRVVDLREVSELIASDAGLKALVLQLGSEIEDASQAFPKVSDCIVTIGIEGLRECLRRARPSVIAADQA
jgi:hypothetical protein